MKEYNDSSQLPKGWMWTKLGGAAQIILGQSPPSSTYNDEGNGLPFYQGKLEFGKIYPTPRKWCTLPKKVAEKGDVLISVRAPVGPTNICSEKCCIGRGLAAIRGLAGIQPLFLLYLTRRFGNVIAGKGTGTTFKAIRSNQLREFEVPLPPLPEQGRIVAKIEEFFTKLDAGLESLKTVKAQLQRYRQTVLKYAFEGKLTEEWRKTHQDQIEPAEVLLESIRKERKNKAKGKSEELPPIDLSNLPELPKGWVWTNTRSISWFVTSGSRDWKKYYSDSGSIFIRTQNINTNRLSLDNVAFVSLPEKVEGKRSLVERNDILIIITGANVGKVALVDLEAGEAYVSQSVALMKLVMPEIARFVHLAMIADGFGKTQFEKMVYGMGRPVLSLKNVQNIILPLAPLQEQHKIVEIIEHHLSIANQTEKSLDRSLRLAARLRKSILKEAFEGKLVPQDSTDEPAEKLLERIKEEKEKFMSGEKRKKKSNRERGLKQEGLIRYVK